MSGNFIGSFESTVCNRRLTIPVKFKNKFASEANDTVVVTASYDGSSIIVFPYDYWLALKTQLTYGTYKQQVALKHYLNYADEQQLEPNVNRIRLKQDILNLTKIEKEIVIKGEDGFFSLWNPEEFKLDRERQRQELEELEQKDKEKNEKLRESFTLLCPPTTEA